MRAEGGYVSRWLTQLSEVSYLVRTEKQLESVTVETMEALARTVEPKDYYTRDHLESEGRRDYPGCFLFFANA